MVVRVTSGKSIEAPVYAYYHSLVGGRTRSPSRETFKERFVLHFFAFPVNHCFEQA